MYRLSTFGFSDMMKCRSDLRALFQDDPASMGEGAERIVQYFYRSLVDDEGRPACALVRFFKTHPYSELEPDLQHFAATIHPEAEQSPEMKCLVLMATAGDREEWNDIRASRGHRAIPLPSEQIVEQAPMISQLIRQMGLSISSILNPDRSLVRGARDQGLNVFHVEEAKGNPIIPAQNEFVLRYGIRSVLGVGGVMTSGDLFATILFSRVPITTATADEFRVLGLNLRVAILPLVRKPLFAH